uniref:Uncharacterized protein n=1 Tax=Anguilla anguilla TaxID=7936 RepID=A0A0E9V4E1_ANGAN
MYKVLLKCNLQTLAAYIHISEFTF